MRKPSRGECVSGSAGLELAAFRERAGQARVGAALDLLAPGVGGVGREVVWRAWRARNARRPAAGACADRWAALEEQKNGSAALGRSLSPPGARLTLTMVAKCRGGGAGWW